ncbi:unnamed protein product [Acanthoscelides obtectus]|uniref:Uncharacterized protein n=1 Tax=Acanthoscelides obtectus TaxID=200917 RepID=A0A9P0QDU3_ACAOB|nr:unnamed protein product [Acanthoscelides obtectus]CAK1687820.1 hypothetical protein AOBTE_LOCUS36387 [Acanthoscelides obtectus]
MNVKGYRIYDPVKNIVTTSIDVVITEKPKKNEIATIPTGTTDSVGDLKKESEVEFEQSEQSSSSDSEYLDGQDGEDENWQAGSIRDREGRSYIVGEEEEAPSVSDIPESPQIVDREKRRRRGPSRYGIVNMCYYFHSRG